MLNQIKKMLIEDGYTVNEPIENLLEIEGYLKDEELEFFLNLAKGATEEEWSHQYMESLKPFCLEKFGRDDVDNLVAEGLFEITQNWADKNLEIKDSNMTSVITQRLNKYFEKIDPNIVNGGLGSIQRMYNKTELKAHTDQDTDPSIRYATIIYLNDDYVDGEVFWTHKNFKIRPKPGTMLVFPGTEEFHHGVGFVGDGPIRYVIVGFVRDINFYEFDREGNRVRDRY